MITPKATFSPGDLAQLKAFLSAGGPPPALMDISMLNGFFTGLLVGPETLLPSQWIPLVFEADPADERVWESAAEAERVMGLLFSYYNSMAKIFSKNPAAYRPLFQYQRVKGQKTVEIDPWCQGFMQAVDLAPESWAPLFSQSEDKELIFPMLLYGTAEGREMRKAKPGFQDLSPADWTEVIPRRVRQLHQYWLPYRRSVADALATTTQHHGVGRNDPCPCGSGKKFKHCCMN